MFEVIRNNFYCYFSFFWKSSIKVLWVKCMTLDRIITKIFIGTINWMQMNIVKKIFNFSLQSVVEGKKNNREISSADLSSINIFACFLNAVP